MPAVVVEQLIAGEWVTGDGGVLERHNPARPAELVAYGAMASADDADRAIRSARAAQPGWARMTSHARGAVMRRAAEILDGRAVQLGRELSTEEGKTLKEGIGEVRRAAQIFDYVGHEPDRQSGELYNSPRPGERILVVRRPVGAVGILTPFNFPIAIPAWKIAPALLHGNTVVWKASGKVPVLAVRLAQALLEAGVPPAVLQLLHGDGPAGRALVDHPGIDAISFTGSTAVGRSIAASAAARGVPVQAEMGGKNAAIVLADADLDLAVAQVVSGAFASTGQKCTATSRLILEEPIADRFVEMLVAATDRLIVGDPLEEGIDLGPLVTGAAREALLSGVSAALASGATAITSRALESSPHGDGHFVPPMVIDCQDGSSDLWGNELFGPVLALRRANGANRAFELANEGAFGLSASVFTRDLESAFTALERLEVGMVHVNSETAGADPHVPFGGVKGSALGPSEQGTAAKEFFTRPSTAYIRSTT